MYRKHDSLVYRTLFLITFFVIIMISFGSGCGSKKNNINQSSSIGTTRISYSWNSPKYAGFTAQITKGNQVVIETFHPATSGTVYLRNIPEGIYDLRLTPQLSGRASSSPLTRSIQIRSRSITPVQVSANNDGVDVDLGNIFDDDNEKFWDDGSTPTPSPTPTPRPATPSPIPTSPPTPTPIPEGSGSTPTPTPDVPTPTPEVPTPTPDVPNKDRYPRGTNIDVKALLRTRENVSLSNKNLSLVIRWDGGQKDAVYLTTNDSGIAIYSMKVPTDPNKDNVYCEFSFSGDDLIISSRNSKRIPIGQ
jgi:hypothetical protein